MNMNIKEVTEITGLSPHTIRFYEKSGLFPKVNRSNTGVRQFTEADVNFIQFVSSLRKSGLSLQVIAEYAKDGCNLAQTKGKNYSAETIQRRVSILESHRERLLEQQCELEMLIDAVNQRLQVYHVYLDQDASGNEEAAL
jgi:DNA-binding transcriptional MerR regulator